MAEPPDPDGEDDKIDEIRRSRHKEALHAAAAKVWRARSQALRLLPRGSPTRIHGIGATRLLLCAGACRCRACCADTPQEGGGIDSPGRDAHGRWWAIPDMKPGLSASPLELHPPILSLPNSLQADLT